MMLTRVPDTIETTDLGTAERDWVRHVLQPSSVLVVPLRSGERVTGALTFSQTEDTGRVFTVYDLDVAIELGTRGALLLEQVVAHRETARARDRADRLQRFAAAMARAATVDAVVEAIASEGLEAVGASILTVAMRSQEEASLDVLHTWLARDDHTGRWETVRPGTETAALEALQTGRAVFFPDLAAYRKRFGDRELSLIAHDIEAVGAIPLHDSSGDVFGSIGFSFAHAQPFDAQQCGFLETVADVAGQSLDARASTRKNAASPAPCRSHFCRRRFPSSTMSRPKRGISPAAPGCPSVATGTTCCGSPMVGSDFSSATPPGAAWKRRRSWAR